MNTPADRPLAAGTVIANNYRVTTRLGEGGMGTVYLAENVTISQRVVVKMLRGGATGAGQEEAQMLANLHHPNVVTVFAHDVAFDCIVMEYLDGSSLSSLLEKGIDRINAIRIGIAVAEALAAVHRRGLVHRDIKPENVMLALNTGSGRLVDWLKLIDFGLALKEGKTPPVLLGTPEYCGPEQFYVQEPAHHGNDIYALGVTLFLMITGTVPFEGEAAELPTMHVTLPPPSLLERLRARQSAKLDPRTTALLEDLDELVQQMMSKQPGSRPSAQEVARRLTKLENSFAEAGTFVGAGPASSEDLAPVRRKRASTSMLSRVSKPSPKPVSSSSSTAPDLVVATVTAVSTDELAPVARATTSSDDVAVPPTERISREAMDRAAPRRSSTPLIIALVALVLLLIAAVVFVKPPSDVAETPTTSSAPEPMPPPSSPTPIEPVNVPEVVAVVDAPKPPPVEPDELTALSPVAKKNAPPQPKSVVKAAPKEPACVWDEARTRGRYQELAQRLPDESQEKFDGDFRSVLASADCRQAEVVFRKMQALIKP
ncbi:MAG: serine/threonine-protein kinase [Archangium sp.]